MTAVLDEVARAYVFPSAGLAVEVVAPEHKYRSMRAKEIGNLDA